MFSDRKFGRISLKAETIEQYPYAVRLLMARLIITHAQFNFATNAMSYEVHSPLLPDLGLNIDAPDYQIELDGGEWVVKQCDKACSLLGLRDWNPIIQHDEQNAGRFKIHLPEKSADMAIGMTEQQAKRFCRAMQVALAAGESLDEAVVTAGNQMRAVDMVATQS